MQLNPSKTNLVQRFLGLFGFGNKYPTDNLDLLTEQQFQKQVQKERLRMLRRGIGFCVVLVRSESPLTKGQYFEFLERVINRVRQTDEVGRYQGQLAVLLADTDIDGGRLVSNHLMAEANAMEIEVDTEVLYPEDFPSSGSDAFQPNTNFRPDPPSNQPGPPAGGSSSGNRPTSVTTKQTAETLVTVSADRSLEIVDEPSAKAELDFEQQQFQLEEYGAAIAVIPPPEPQIELRKITRPELVSPVPFEEIPAAPLASPKSTKTPGWKRAMDIAGSSIGLVLLSPLLLAVAIAIRLESKGGAFFSQLREGRDGKEFWILKFRTMVVDAEEQKAALREHSEQDGPAFKMTNDPRITRIGKILRKTCIDELPQLWNVLKGDMSLVGPRPLPVEESKACCQWQRRRLDVLPGLTCLWQVQDQREIPFSDWMRLDLQYLKTRSFFGDWKLIFKTIWVAVRVKGSV